MLNFVVISLLISAASAFDLKTLREELMSDKNFTAAKELCMKEVGVEAEELKYNPDEKYEPEYIEHLRCFSKCVHEKRGYLDENGKVVIEALDNLPVFSFITENQKNLILECLKGIEIKECADVQKEVQCFHEVLKIN